MQTYLNSRAISCRTKPNLYSISWSLKSIPSAKVTAKPRSDHNIIVSITLRCRVFEWLAFEVWLQVEQASSDALEKLLKDSWNLIFQYRPLVGQFRSHFPDEFRIPVHMTTFRSGMIAVIDTPCVILCYRISSVIFWKRYSHLKLLQWYCAELASGLIGNGSDIHTEYHPWPLASAASSHFSFRRSVTHLVSSIKSQIQAELT